MKSPCILVTGPDRCEAGEVEIPEIQAHEILVENVLTGISPGTELRCLGGKVYGGAKWPYVPGYSGVGRVVKAGRESGFTEGAWVAHGGSARLVGAERTWGGHVAHAISSGKDACTVAPGVPLDEAVAARLAGIPQRGVRLAAPRPGEAVVVIGLGLIGHLAARLFAHRGARVVALDTSAPRVAAIRAVGLEGVEVGADLLASARAVFPDGADIVVDCTGVPSLPLQAVHLLREFAWGQEAEKTGGRLVLQGNIDGKFSLDYYDLFFREVSVLVPRDATLGDRKEVVDLVSSRRLRLHGVVGEIAAPADCAAVYERLKMRHSPLITAAFRWRAGDVTG